MYETIRQWIPKRKAAEKEPFKKYTEWSAVAAAAAAPTAKTYYAHHIS